MHVSLQGKKVVVIGGSSGIGLGIAKASQAAGAAVVIASRSAEKLAAASQEMGGDVETYAIDLTDEQALAQMMADLAPLDHLVVSGGSGPTFAPFLELPAEAARLDFEITFWGKYNAAKYAAPHLSSDGSIVFISGVYARRPNADAVVSAASLSAVEGLCRALALALAPIRVNAIMPALVDTPLFNPDVQGQAREAMFAAIGGNLPANRVATPENIGQMAVVLMTNQVITGSTMLMDGGYALV